MATIRLSLKILTHPDPKLPIFSDADAAWTQQIDHVSRANSTITDPYIALAQQDVHMLNTAMDDTDTGSANSARPLNVNPDGSPLTYRTATHGADSADWLKAEDTEWDRLLGTKTCHAIHLHQQPLDRRGDTTYYNPKPKEKYDDDMNKVYRIRGTAGGDRINYDDPTKAVHGPVTECPAITSDPHSSIIGLAMSSRQLPQHLISPCFPETDVTPTLHERKRNSTGCHKRSLSRYS